MSFPSRPVLWWGAALALGVAAVYARTLGFSLLQGFDDPAYLGEPAVAAGLTWEGARWALTSLAAGHWHPLTWVSHMAAVSLFGMEPWGHRLANLLLHAAGTLALFLALRSLTGSLHRSALVAALWALHPLRVESVAWVAERKDLLCGLFFFLTLLSWARYARSPSPGRYAVSLLLFAAALAGKATAVSLPLVLLLLDLWPLGRWNASGAGPGSRAWRLVREKFPFLLLALLAAALAAHASALEGATDLGGLGSGLGERLGNGAAAAGAYLRQTVLPTGLAFFYPPRSPGLAGAGWGALLLLLTGGALAVARRWPFLAVGWGWFLLALLPMSGIVPLGSFARADRFTYLPHAGLFLALVWGGWEMVRGRSRALRTGAPVAAVLALVALAAASFRQTESWRDDESLFRHALSSTERNWLAAGNLGGYLWERGRTEEGERMLRRALSWEGGFHYARINLARLLAGTGREGEAEGEYRAVAATAPRDPRALLEAGSFLLFRGRREEGRELLLRMAALRPSVPGLYNEAAAVLEDAGFAAEAEAMRSREGKR